MKIPNNCKYTTEITSADILVTLDTRNNELHNWLIPIILLLLSYTWHPDLEPRISQSNPKSTPYTFSISPTKTVFERSKRLARSNTKLMSLHVDLVFRFRWATQPQKAGLQLSGKQIQNGSRVQTAWGTMLNVGNRNWEDWNRGIVGELRVELKSAPEIEKDSIAILMENLIASVDKKQIENRWGVIRKLAEEGIEQNIPSCSPQGAG